MNNLEAIKPSKKNRVYDLVAEAGIEIEDWKASSKDKNNFRANPKYCYEWVFPKLDDITVAGNLVLSIWFEPMQLDGDQIIQHFNMKKDVEFLRRNKVSSPQIGRAIAFQKALEFCNKHKKSFRVIVNTKANIKHDDPKPKKSSVEFRQLDQEHWHVKKHDSITGEATIARGPLPRENLYIDQFSVREELPTPPDAKDVTSKAYPRSEKVRADVLARAAGHCEFCGTQGFKTHSGEIYLETHHIVPLSKKGIDHTSNVAALCANDHKEAHYSDRRDEIALFLEKKITTAHKLLIGTL